MPYQLEPHRLVDRACGKLLFLPATAYLLRAMRRRRPTELWIGDSHAMGVNRAPSNSNFMRAPEGQLILRAGPRLMYSLARKGFPPRVLRVVELVHRYGRRGAFVPVFSAGDIDVRAHLSRRPDATFEFVAEYVDRCVRLADRLKAERLAFLVPPPPVDARPEEVWFPVVGTIEDRLTAQKKLVAALTDAVAAVPHAVLLDFTDLLTGSTGGMPIAFTGDGAHTNLDTVAAIRAELETYELVDPA